MAVRLTLYCCRVSLLPLCNLMDHCGKWINGWDYDQHNSAITLFLLWNVRLIYTAYGGSSKDDNIWLCWRLLRHMRQVAIRKANLHPSHVFMKVPQLNNQQIPPPPHQYSRVSMISSAPSLNYLPLDTTESPTHKEDADVFNYHQSMFLQIENRR